MKKGQYAVEFLITYGWAFLVVLGGIAVLWYLDIFDATSFLSAQCTFYSGFVCLEHQVNITQVTLIVSNALPLDIDNIQVYIGDCGFASGPTSLDNAQTGTYVSLCSLIADASFDENIRINFTSAVTGENHTSVGYIQTRVS